MKIVFGSGRTFSPNAAQGAFFLIVVLTLFNGLFNSLYYEFIDHNDDRRCTFLASPSEIYGDLLRPAMAAPPFRRPDTRHWKKIYIQYLDRFKYVSTDFQNTQKLATFSVPIMTPFTLLPYLIEKRMIMIFPIEFLVALSYGAALLGLWMTCRVLSRDLRSAGGAFLVLLFSYPFLMIVSRGNIGSMVTGFSLILFLHAVLVRKSFFPALLFLFLAVSIRPNVLLLCPLLLCFGWRQLILGSALAVLGFALEDSLFFRLDALFYPAYGPVIHWLGLQIYKEKYIIGFWGDEFNSSAFGAVKFLICAFRGRECSDMAESILAVNFIFTAGFTLLLLRVTFLFFRQKLSALTFAYMAVCCYTLASTIFAAYHLFIYAGFLLLLLREARVRKLEASDLVILAGSALMLSPKNYIFVEGISVEVVLNPLILVITILCLLRIAHGGFSSAVEPDRA